MGIKYFGVFLLITFLVSCSDYESSNDNSKDSINNDTFEKIIEEDTIPNIFKHQLAKSDLFYDIEITKIKFKRKKDAFEITREQFAKPESIDGMTLKLNFKMTNPYDKEMRVPFPTYYFITAPQFGVKNGFIYSRRCKCYIDNTTTITSKDGKSLYEFSKRKGMDYMIDFRKNETKEFVISFTDVFPKFENLKTITLGGFNKYIKQNMKALEFQKMPKTERENYLADKSKIHALEISIKDEVVIQKGEFEK